MDPTPPPPGDLRERLQRLDPERRNQLVAGLRSGRTRAEGAAPPWFLRPEPVVAPSLRMFCFSYAGGGASVFRRWPALIAPGVEICAVQLPGREWRVGQAPYRRIEALLPDLVAAVAPLTDVPFAFFGHSMGALVAFELARVMRRLGGAMPEQLFLSAFRAPQLPNPNIRIYHLPDEVLRTVLLKEGTPEEVLRNDDLMKALLPTLRADFELCDTYEYRPEQPLAMPLHVFGGHQDVRVGRHDLEPWAQLAGGEFGLTMLPGSHFFIHGSQDLLLEAVNQNLTMPHMTDMTREVVA